MGTNIFEFSIFSINKDTHQQEEKIAMISQYIFKQCIFLNLLARDFCYRQKRTISSFECDNLHPFIFMKLARKQSYYRQHSIINLQMKFNLLILTIIALSTGYASILNTTQFWRRSLNESDLHFQCFAGYQQINWYYPKGDSGMYYQLFGAMGANVNQSNPSLPLMIWLQGGPGASSMFGAFTQIGPIRVVNGTVKTSSYPWNIFGHLLFIDQPLNVGFSFYGNRTGKKQVSDSNQAGKHLQNFLYNFYKEWPLLRDSPLYIMGESFAGHFIPAFARTILLNSSFMEQTNIKVQGAVIGDGWTDPINQINFFDSMLYSAGIVSNKYRDTATWVQTQSILKMYDKDYAKATAFYDIIISNETTSQVYWGGMSVYNVRSYQSLDTSFATFLQANKANLGVADKVDFIWVSDPVYESFHPDVTTTYISDLIILLKRTRVLIYNGQNDFVVNTAGVLQYLNGMNWDGIDNWKKGKKKVWSVHGQIRGWAKVSGNLWFALVNGAGHMVPSDQPESAFSLMGHFLSRDQNWRE